MQEKNEDFFKVGNSRTVEVTIRLDLDTRCNDVVVLRNAADALKFRAEAGHNKSFVKSVSIRRT